MDEEQVRELRSRLEMADDMLRGINDLNDHLEALNRDLNASRSDWKACAERAQSRLAAIEAAKAGEPPIPVWHEHDRYNYAEPEHRFRARLEDWGREGWDAAAALRVEVEELREAASSAVLAYGAHAHAQLRELFNESKSGDTLKALDALALAMSNLDIALQADPATQGEVQP